MPKAPPVHKTPNPSSDAAQRIRNGARWQKYRDWFKRRHPLCADPLKVHSRHGRVVPSKHVHHIRPLSQYPDLAFVESNCAALCAGCHSTIEAMIRSGKAVGGVFEG